MFKETNERFLAILSVIILLFTQVFTPITVLAQGTDESAGLNEELYEVNVEQEGSNNISLEQKSSHKITKLNIELSEGTTIDKQKLEQELSSESKINYEEDKHIINIESEKGINKKMLLKFSKNDSNNFWIHLEAFENDLRVTDEKHDLKFEQKVVSQRDEAKTRQSDIISPRVGDLNTDIDISAYTKTVESGNTAMYKVVLKTTGSQKKYDNATLKVKLPIKSYTEFNQKLSELKIAGVTPVLDKENHTLIYSFENQLRAGETYEKIIKIDTQNFSIPNGQELMAKVSLETEDFKYDDSATVSIVSSNKINLTKQYILSEYNKETLAAPSLKSYVRWEIKVDIPKKDKGQMYLKEDSEIVVTDLLPKGLSFSKMASSASQAPTIEGNKLVWKFKAPSLEEQTKSNQSLFNKTLVFWTKVDDDPKLIGKELTNVSEATATFIDGKTIFPPASSTSKTKVVTSEPTTGEIKGAWYVPYHYGPIDGVGNSGKSKEDMDENISVSDNAWLKFKHNLTSLLNGQDNDFKEYYVDYNIDSNLKLEKIHTPERWYYKPNSSYPFSELKKLPTYDVYGIVNGKKTLLVKNADDDRAYTRKDMNLKDTDKISKITYSFTYAPKGMYVTPSASAEYFFTVKEGHIGKVENKLDFYGIDHNGDEYELGLDKGNHDNVGGPRSVNIVGAKELAPPIASIGIELKRHKNGEIILEKNRVKVSYINENISPDVLSGPIEAVVLLPIGVKLSDIANESFIDNNGQLDSGTLEVIEENYNKTGRQLIKLIWNEKNIRINSELVAEFDVDIFDSASNTLKFEVYGFSGNREIKVPSSSGNSITDTILQKDDDDLNNDGIIDQPRIKSGNIYTISGSYDLQTEKFVKGELDNDWSKLGQTKPGGKIDYKLNLTNTTGKDISKMTLIDVLPSVGDLGITDNISRGSKFTPTMTGPIELPKEWENKVKVFYSEEKTPKRDDLIRYTEYPDTTEKLSNPPQAKDPNWKSEQAVTDWSKIHSFKIELIEGEEWLTGVDMEVLFSMKAPEANEVDKALLDKDIKPLERATCNSFAVATEHGQPVEPAQVCAYMNYEVEEPELEKTVNEQKDVYDLINKDETFTWEVSYEFGNYTGDWESVVLSDEINELLTIEEVIVIDQNGQDVTSNGKLTTDDNLVKFELLKKDGNFSYLENQTYQLIIKSKISEETSDKDLLPYINDSGIPNQAELIINDNPKPSNEVSVKPPELNGSLKVIKVDDESEETLKGAEFELRDAEGKVIATAVTDDKGSFIMQDLDLGKYQLVETKAPKGYRLLKKPIDVEITADELHLELEVENSKSKWELPSTAGIGTLIFYLTGLALVLASLLFILKNKHRTV